MTVAANPGSASRSNPTRLPRTWLAASVGLVVLALFLGLASGPISLSVTDVAAVLLDRLPRVSINHEVDRVTTAIIVEVRLPRVILAGLVGAVLASAGGAYQATFRNALADPYLLGAAGGAGLGATIVLTETGNQLASTNLAVTAAAFVGAMLAVSLAYALGRSGDGRTGASLILAGVAVAALCSALQTLLLQRDDEAIRDVYAWLLGRLNVAGWDEVLLLFPIAVLTIGVMIGAARHLDLLALGDDEAESLGVNTARLRIVVIAAATLGTASAVAVSGLIGFVGIVVPHAIRLRTGPTYRRILPLSAILGVAFMVLADLAARTLLVPAEIPIGVVTAAVGAPFFLVLLRTSRVRPT